MWTVYFAINSLSCPSKISRCNSRGGSLGRVLAPTQEAIKSRKNEYVNMTNSGPQVQPDAVGPSHGYGSKLNHQGTAGFGPCFHVPGFHFGHLFLTHSHIVYMRRTNAVNMCQSASRPCKGFPVAQWHSGTEVTRPAGFLRGGPAKRMTLLLTFTNVCCRGQKKHAPDCPGESKCPQAWPQGYGSQ